MRGICYYKELFHSIGDTFIHTKKSALEFLNDAVKRMQEMGEEIAILIEKNRNNF